MGTKVKVPKVLTRSEIIKAMEPFARLYDPSMERRTGGDAARVYGFVGPNGNNCFTVGDVKRLRAIWLRLRKGVKSGR